MHFIQFQVRDELEHLLDDDEDMAEMYLTEKLLQQLENSSTGSSNDMDDEVLRSNMDDRHGFYFVLALFATLCEI